MTRGIFVTGTDTGVGKTAVACGILAALRAAGPVAALKPAESALVGGRPMDATCLADAAGGEAAPSEVAVYQFSEALAPAVAARRAGVVLDPVRLDAAFEAAARRGFVVVEGAGGLLVPLTDSLSMADLAARWQLPVLVVARAGLGTLNHTALTVEAARRRDLSVVGLVLNGASGRPDAAEETNPQELERITGTPVLGRLPWAPAVDIRHGVWQPMERLVAEHIDLRPVLRLMKGGGRVQSARVG